MLRSSFIDDETCKMFVMKGRPKIFNLDYGDPCFKDEVLTEIQNSASRHGE
ncbi:MAG: hypothetical protein H6R19_1634 [Proteobacteria bacterium]|nr:hypothetical protein [Pseudomonadota bacterium]